MDHSTPQTHTFAARTLACPACGNETLYAPDNPYRPFCSARCKGLDFGAWANEHYRVQAQEPHEGRDAYTSETE